MKPFAYTCLLFNIAFYGLLCAQVIEPSANCRECHADIVAEWKASRLAQSNAKTNTFYAAMLASAKQSADKKFVSQCKRCHEPALFLQAPAGQELPSVSEGVTCDVCHATRLVSPANGQHLKLQGGNIKYGRLKDAISVSHECEYYDTLGKSSFCLACHGQAETSHGIPFCSTEDEWRQSSFSQKGVQCQDCHMPAVEGLASQLGKLRDAVHSHRFYGGYAEDFMRNCAEIDLEAEARNGDIMVRIAIKNKGVGHALPTGSPMRMVYLKVEARDEEQNPVWKNWYSNPLKEDTKAVFMRLLQDGAGNAPVLPWKAESIQFDQRLMPDETRSLEYVISEPTAQSIHVSLVYRLAPPDVLRKLNIRDEMYFAENVIQEKSVQVEDTSE